MSLLIRLRSNSKAGTYVLFIITLVHFEVRNCKNMENTFKIKVFGKSILFCKYLCEEGSDLHEIFFGVQLLSYDLKFTIS